MILTREDWSFEDELRETLNLMTKQEIIDILVLYFRNPIGEI